MNSSRRLPLPSDDLPRKRIRLEEPADLDREIALLNESGVSNMRKGKIDDAQLFFVKALDCFKAKQQGLPLPNETVHRSDFSTSDHGLQGFSNVSTTCQRAPSSSEQQEYDEGVHPFSETMTMTDDDCKSMQPVTLYYNVALTFIKLRKYQDASRWFKLALICINLNPSSAVTLVRTYHNLGFCCYRLGESSNALLCFQKAEEIATAAGFGAEYTANSRNAFAVVLFHSSTVNHESIALFEKCLQDFTELFGNESKQVATTLNNLGRASYADADFDGALDSYKKALEIRRRVLPDTSIDIAATICSTGQTLHRLQELDAAIEYYREFLDLASTGQYSNRDRAIITKNLAEIHHKKGMLNEAKELYEEALHTGRLGFGSVHPEVASILNRLGNWYYEAKDMKEALKCYTEGLGIEHLTLPPCHPRIIVTLTNIAQIHYNFGEYNTALQKYNHIYALQLEARGPTSLEVAKVMSTMAEMEYKMKNYEESFALFQDVLLIQRVNFGDSAEGLEIASTMNSLGIVAFAQGDFSVAKNFFSCSLEIRRKKLGPNHKDTATLWYNLATTHEEIGDDEMALKMYKETLRIEREGASSDKSDTVDTLKRIGRLYQSRGLLQEALSNYKEALESLRSKGEGGSFLEGKLLNLIGNVHLQNASVTEMMKCYTEASYIYRESEKPPSEVLVIAGYYLYGLAKLHPPCAAVA